MAIVTAEDLKRQLALTDDAPADDLAQLDGKIAAAEAHIERLLGFGFEDTYGENPVPEPLKEAVLQLAAWWFENREAVTSQAEALPFGVAEIVNEYRDWSF